MGRVRISIELAVLLILTAALGISIARGRTVALKLSAELARMTVFQSGSDDFRIGEPDVFDNLAVYPIFTALQSDVGPVISLQAALANATAEVRELGAETV